MLNILIVGVGGQGSLLSSKILGSLFTARGLEVKVSEVHGMSQRGGSVVTFVRAGERVASPLVEHGEADVIISFEELEALRYLPWLRRGGTVVVSTQRILPMPVIMGGAAYPEGIVDRLRDMGVQVVAFDAMDAARRAGSERAANIALLGAAARVLRYGYDEFAGVLSRTVRPEFLAVNLQAFENGFQACAESGCVFKIDVL